MMFRIVYKYGSNTKVAYVCACSTTHAKQILISDYLAGDIQIESVSEMSHGTVLYTNGRF